MEIKRLYLDKLESEIFDCQPIDPKLGFSEDECYDLDRTMVALLYERLKEYMRIIESKEIDFIDEYRYDYKEDNYTAREMLNKLIVLCLSYLEKTSIQGSISQHKEIWDSIWDIWKLIGSDIWI